MADEQKVMVGDTIEVEVSFQHSANVERVEATFVNPKAPNGSEGVEFHETHDSLRLHLRERGGLTTDHTARLQADIGPEHVPGTYRCASCTVVTAGGKEHSFSRFPHFRFEVVPEPEAQPVMQGDFRPV